MHVLYDHMRSQEHCKYLSFGAELPENHAWGYWYEDKVWMRWFDGKVKEDKKSGGFLEIRLLIEYIKKI